MIKSTVFFLSSVRKTPILLKGKLIGLKTKTALTENINFLGYT